MNRIPRRLKKEPLIEAVWQIQFEPIGGTPVGDLLPGALFNALRNEHATLQLERLPTADIPVQIASNDPNLRNMAKYRMEAPDSPFIFQFGDRIVTLNCRRPYAGWQEFRRHIVTLLSHIQGCGIVPVPQRHSLRYINLLTLDPAPSLAALQASVKVGVHDCREQPIQARVELCDEAYTHVLQLVTPAQVQLPNGSEVGTLVDLETFPMEKPQAWGDIESQIDCLHERLLKLFFGSILTAETIAKMEPEYEA